MRASGGLAALAVAACAVFAVGCWAAARVCNASDRADPGVIVIDEVAGQWFVLLAAPLDVVSYALAFVLFRIFDIAKPWPVSWADRRVKGGFGVMLDDVLAAGYAAIVLFALLAIADVRH